MLSDCPAKSLPLDADYAVEKTMFIRNAAVAAILSTVMFGTGAALADSQMAALAPQVDQAKANHWSSLYGGAGREEHLLAEQNLAIADHLLKQGQVEKAQSYLNIALGLMGQPVKGVASSSAVKAFTPDFYNPVR